MASASRQSSYLLGSVGAVLQVVAGWWDVYSHLIFGSFDPWWNPAHLMLYAGVAIVILAVWQGLRVRNVQPSYAVSPIRFVNTSGLKIAGVGSLMQVIAGGWNEIVHHIFLSEPKIAPAHTLLTLGMLTTALGMIVGLAIEYGMVMQRILAVSTWRRYAIVLCLILVFSSIWLTAAGAFIYVARAFPNDPFNWIMAMMLSIIGPFVLVSAKRVLPQFGSGTAIGLIFNSVAFFFLVVYAETPAYFPWGILTLLLLDSLVVGLSHAVRLDRAIAISSAVPGLLFPLTYFPFTLYLFPWSFTAQLPLLVTFLGSAIGVILGDRVYTSISTLVLRGLS